MFKEPITEEDKAQPLEENKNESDDEVDKVSDLSQDSINTEVSKRRKKDLRDVAKNHEFRTEQEIYAEFDQFKERVQEQRKINSGQVPEVEVDSD